MTLILEMILVFLVSFVVDIIWTFYIQHTAGKNAALAAHSGSLIYFFGGVVTYSYNHNFILLIPASIGAWVGIYASVKFSIYLDKRKNNIGS